MHHQHSHFQSKAVTMLGGPVETTGSGIRTQTRLGVVVVRQISGSSPQLREKVGICLGMKN